MSPKSLVELTDEELSELDNTLRRVRGQVPFLHDGITNIHRLVIFDRHIRTYAAMGLEPEEEPELSMAQMLRGCSVREAAAILEGFGEQVKDLYDKMVKQLAAVDCTENIVFCNVAAELENLCTLMDKFYLGWERVLTDKYKPILRKIEEITDTSLARQDTSLLLASAQYDIAQVTYDTFCVLGYLIGHAEQGSSLPDEAGVLSRVRVGVDEWLDEKGHEPSEVVTLTGAIELVQDYLDSSR